MKIYFRPGTCALAPQTVLHWLGLEHEAVNAPRDDSFKAINPSGAVPALEIAPGDILTQAGAIMVYLAEVADRPDLLGGEDLRQRAEVSQWESFFTGDFHPAFFPVFVPQRYTLNHEADSLASVKASAENLVANGLAQIEAQLDGTDWFVGSSKTIIDAYAVPMLRWVKFATSLDLCDWPNTQRFYDRMSDDAGIAAAMATQGIKP
ncbi:MAG: glutathione S-transferase family protein [Pseudomonadota bacterium]